MGISEGLVEGTGIDCSVGAIVWVRRRNGSWWPGRILGPNELSESHLMSPRSGTPVKLLGREDASVDWYNLEKSKRVKAFRSGEFDDCIERAESAQGVPIKKREKYARRDDAILHALELERVHLEKKQQKPGMGPNCMSNRMPDISNKELGICSSENFLGNDKARGHCRFINLKSQTLCKKPDSSEVESTASLLYVPNGELSKPSWEDDSSEALPRMRGLQDLGLSIAPSKRKTSASIACRTSGQPVSVDSHLYVLSSVGNNISGIKNSTPLKRNRSQRGMNEDSLVRRRDRRRPIVQVLQTSAKLPVCQPLQSDGDAMSMTLQGRKERGLRSPSYQMQMSPTHFGMNSSLFHPSSLIEECTNSGLIEAQESDSFEGEYLDPDTEEEEALISDPINLGRYISCGSVYQVPVQAGNVDNEDLDESELSSYESQHQHDEQTAGISPDMGGSKWQLKGKRNIRNLMNRPIELVDRKDSVTFDNRCNGVPIQESLNEGKGNIVSTARMNRQRLSVQQRSEELSYTDDEDDLVENDLELGQTQSLVFGNRKYPSILKASSRDRGISNSNFISSDEDSLVMSPSMWEPDQLSQATLKGYWKESDGWFNPTYVSNFCDWTGSMLVDVDLKVQASYKGEHVPLVSLMSKLNGKAIVGHPVQVEKLEDGSSDLLLCRDDFCEELPNDYEKTALPPVWRTARRTTMHRAPRPPPSPALERGEASFVLYSDLGSGRPFKKLYADHIKNKVKVIKGTSRHIRQPLLQKKFSKKLLKKVSSSSLKTRTLSSIAIEQRCSSKTCDSKQADKNVELYGLIKAEGTVPVMTCVPVKLAFSRILEAIGRPPSISANRRGFQQIVGS